MSLNLPTFDFPTLIIWLIGGIVCFAIAKNKKRNPWLWLLLGILFNLFAVVILLLLPDGDLEDELLKLKARVRVLESAGDEGDHPIVKVQKPKVE